MCAQLTSSKGWFDFIKVCERLRERIPALKAYIVGNGPLYFEIEKKIKDTRLEKIIKMTGHTNNVFHYLSQTDIYIMTSYSEGLSVAVIEAMASSLPLVLYDFSGSSDQVEHGFNGYVVGIGNTESMIKRILDIYTNGKTLFFGNNSREIYKRKFTEEVMVKSYVKIYKDVLGER